MYLLNPKAVSKKGVMLDKFTFHYVSIKSIMPPIKNTVFYVFTFHYVSIKSYGPIVPGTISFDIYIPLCIY